MSFRQRAGLVNENPHREHPQSVPTPDRSRRTFFGSIIAAAAGLIGISLAVPLVGYVISPSLKRRAETWTDVGGVEEVKQGEPRQMEYVSTVRDGWMEMKLIKAVWAIKQPDQAIRVFSPLCPHLGCGYRWDGSERKFICPCHASIYDINGKVLAGPAPRPLDPLPVRIKDGRIFIIYKQFRPGLSTSTEI